MPEAVMPAATLADAVAASDGRLDDAMPVAGPAAGRAQADAPGGRAAERYVLLSIASTHYAVLQAFVTEIDRVPRTTPVPHVPAWVRGVTSLRGDILSVIDLRSWLGLDGGTPRTARLLVVRLLTEELSTGLIVDGVERIVEIPTPAIGAPESALEGPLAPFIGGLCAVGERTVAVLDIDRLLRSPEIRRFEAPPEDSADMEGQGTSCEER